jgi:hypothetical protein
MKTMHKKIMTAVLGLSLAISITAAPLEEGTEFCLMPQLHQLTDKDGNMFYGNSTILPGDIVFFAGKPSEPDDCKLYTARVIIVDPTHERKPLVATALTFKPIPAGTRASVSEGGRVCLDELCFRKGYGGSVLVVAK